MHEVINFPLSMWIFWWILHNKWFSTHTFRCHFELSYHNSIYISVNTDNNLATRFLLNDLRQQYFNANFTDFNNFPWSVSTRLIENRARTTFAASPDHNRDLKWTVEKEKIKNVLRYKQKSTKFKMWTNFSLFLLFILPVGLSFSQYFHVLPLH